MGTIDQVLYYDALPPGKDPTYEFGNAQDIWYLGFTAETASEIKCSRITLPMLSKETFDWKEKFKKSIIEAISLKPQTHIDTFQDAYIDFTKYTFSWNTEFPNEWFGSQKTIDGLKSQVSYETAGNYKDVHECVKYKGVELDLPFKLIVFVPKPEDFGVLCINEDFFNFMFIYDNIKVYRLKHLDLS